MHLCHPTPDDVTATSLNWIVLCGQIQYDHKKGAMPCLNITIAVACLYEVEHIAIIATEKFVPSLCITVEW